MKQCPNPAPATKILRLIKDFKAERFARLLSFAVYINATSTPQQKNRIRTQWRASAGAGKQLAVAYDSRNRHHRSMYIEAVGWR